MRHTAVLFFLAMGCGAPVAPLDTSSGGGSNNTGGGSRADALAAADALCDGTNDLRFGIAPVGGGPLSDEDLFYAQNGHMRVAVDGKCQIWTHGTETFDATTLRGRIHVGQLTRDEFADLLQDARWDRWQEVASLNLNESCTDVGGYRLRNEHDDFSIPSCIADSAPRVARDTGAAVVEALASAVLRGEQDPVASGDVRYRIDPRPYEGNADFVLDWPAEMGPLPAPMVPDEGPECMGDSVEVAAGDPADALRQLRDRFIVEANRRYVSRMLVTDGTNVHRFMMRDVDPYEDELGHSTFPGGAWSEHCD